MEQEAEVTPKIKELLAVLDLPEEEQQKWMFIHGVIHHHPTDENRIESLADLAFRLRPEPSREYHKALRIVFHYWVNKIGSHIFYDGYEKWLEFHITAIDRIIAALIVTEGHNDKDGL